MGADFTDFAVVAKGGKEIRCHKPILAGASPVLKGLLSTDMQEGRQGFANIDEDEVDLNALLEYIYMERLPTSADHNLLLSVMRLSDIYQVPSLSAACASRLLPLVCKENILQVLRGLKQLQDVNQDYERLFKDVQDLVKNDEQLLALVCLSVAPNEASGDTMAEATPQPWHERACLEEGVLNDVVESVSVSDIAEHNPSKSQAGTDPSNTGSSHVPSGSSEQSELGDRERSSVDRKMCSAKQTESQMGGMEHHSGECSNIEHFALPLSPASDVGSASYPREKPDSAAARASKAESPTDVDQVVGASSSSNLPHPSSCPRRKTRRGKSSQKRRRDQMSIPDTYNSWN